MKKILILVVYIFLAGCASVNWWHVFPKYYDNKQKILLRSPVKTTVKIDDHGNMYSSEPILVHLLVDRSFSSLKGTLSKQGFEDKQIEIKSHLTGDKWGDPKSALYLLPTVHTVINTWNGIEYGFTSSEGIFNILAPIKSVVWGGIGCILGVGTDVYNLFYGIPSVIIANPWYEYDKEIDLTKEILTPTTEFEKTCHSQKGTFIGNNDCLSCSMEKVVISIEEECNRCSNRKWSNFECSLK